LCIVWLIMSTHTQFPDNSLKGFLPRAPRMHNDRRLILMTNLRML
jgi:hypothetical protein